MSANLQAAIRNHASALQRIASDKTGDFNIDHQMSAIKIMAEAILDLRALDLPLMSPPPLPLSNMLHLATHTNDLYTFHFALREFAVRTETILDMETAMRHRSAREPW